MHYSLLSTALVVLLVSLWTWVPFTGLALLGYPELDICLPGLAVPDHACIDSSFRWSGMRSMDTTGDTFGHFPRLFGDRPALCEQRDTDSVRVRGSMERTRGRNTCSKKVEGGANRETAKFGLKFASHLMRPMKVLILSAMRWHFLQNINSLEIGESAEGHIDLK